MKKSSCRNLRPTLSAIIITRDEETDIKECLDSVNFCDEIVVVDSGSVDRTVQIALACGAIVIQTKDWPGFGIQKQRALEAASGEWILSIDADERVPQPLRDEIIESITRNQNVGFEIRRANFFLGRQMYFGGWGRDYVLRLAKRTNSKFTEKLVHESLLTSSPIRRLSSPMLHYSYKSIDDVLEKQIRYARLGATSVAKRDLRNKIGIFSPSLRGFWTFTRLYFIQLGFLDGWRGSLAAAAKSIETFWRYALARHGD